MSRGWVDDDEYAQVDGDAAPPANFAPFQPVNGGQPWLRTPMPPWHMWGNSTILTAIAGGQQATGQLVKLAYRRPETWNFIFSAKLIEGPTAGALDNVAIAIFFDLIAGIGRSNIVIDAFELLQIGWSNSAAPVGRQVFTTSVQSLRLYNQAPPAVPLLVRGADISDIVAQDLQVSARVIVTPSFSLAGTPVRVEVSSQFAPKTHIRPDWYLDAPAEAVFAGAETEGK